MNATLEYRRNAVLTAPREKLVLMMFDGALRFARLAHARMQANDAAECGRMISRAFNIVSELRVSLDMNAGGPEGRRIAENLGRLYAFVMDSFITANSQRRPEGLEDGIAVLETLRDAWRTVAEGK